MRPPQRGCLRENTRDMTSVLCWCSTTASSDTSVGYIATPNTASPPVGYHHVAEHEPSARPEPVGDAGEQVRLTCSVEVVHVECRHDEVELPSAVGPGDGSPADRRRRPLRIVRGRSAFRPRPHNRLATRIAGRPWAKLPLHRAHRCRANQPHPSGWTSPQPSSRTVTE